MTTCPRAIRACAAFAVLAIALASPGVAAAASKIRLAFGDIASTETLHVLIAVERAKERGVPIEITYFKSEDIAAQAVLGGQADVGVGTPYAMMQKVKAPIRVFYQLSKLRFYPIVNTEFYKSWKDLDGQEIAVHSRGSGTEAIMKLMAQRQGIAYKNISYVPGSEVRAGALLQGNVKATIVDSAGRRLVMDKGGSKFAVLPMDGISASDDALFANTAFLEREAASIDILVESLLTTWREVNANPGAVAPLRTRYKLLPDLPKDLESGITPYFEETAAGKTFPNNGGIDGVNDDIAFFTLAGHITGDPASVKVDDFWDLRPLDRALKKLGRQ